jgi:hypothetical protein
MSVQSEYDTGYDFKKISSFRLMGSSATPDINKRNVLRIEHALIAQLENKGLKMVTKHPDILIVAFMAKEEQEEETRWGDAYEYEVSLRQYEEGTLKLRVIDAKTEQIIWQGEAKLEIEPSWNQERKKEKIIELARKILEGFPPGRNN